MTPSGRLVKPDPYLTVDWEPSEDGTHGDPKRWVRTLCRSRGFNQDVSDEAVALWIKGGDYKTVRSHNIGHLTRDYWHGVGCVLGPQPDWSSPGIRASHSNGQANGIVWVSLRRARVTKTLGENAEELIKVPLTTEGWYALHTFLSTYTGPTSDPEES